MSLKAKIVAIFIAGLCAVGESKDYEGYQMIQVTPASESDVTTLRQIKLQRVDGVNFLTDGLAVGVPTRLLIPPHFRAEFSQTLEENGVPFTVQQADVKKYLEEAAEFSRQWNKKLEDEGRLFDVYLRFAPFPEIVDWMTQRASHSAATLLNIGRTYENRDMLAMQISDDPSANKPAFWIDCAIHAREWITPPACTYIINELLEGLTNNNARIVALVQKFDWYILPVTNPDGYVYTFSSDRYWRKTRTPNPDTSFWGCRGTDGNRNFDYAWFDPDNIGSSDWGCDDTYRGEDPFSEPSTRAVRDFITPRQSRIRAFMSMHSYGSMWLAPYSYDFDVRPGNAAELDRVGRLGMAALMSRHGNTGYEYGTVPELLGYYANGGSMDWAMGTANIPYGYGMEFRGNDFVVPESQIVPNSEEVWEGVMAVAEEIQA